MFTICKMNIIVSAIVVLGFTLLEVSGQSRIVGGDVAPPEFGSFHASLQNLNGRHVCGGVVISEWLVITAAHCVYEVDPSFIKVVSGTSNLNNGGIASSVNEIIVHDEYNNVTSENDIALIKVATPFDMSYIRVLKFRTQKLEEGEEVSLSGFGSEEPNGPSSCDMKVLNLTVFNQETCEYAMRYSQRIVTDRMFCTFSKIGEGTCHGDSGGPLVKGSELVGVISWGMPCAIGFPDVHTRITPYVEWIEEHIRQSYCLHRRSPLNLLQKLGQIAKYTTDVPEGLENLLEMERLKRTDNK